MKLLFDTSILVLIDRGANGVRETCKHWSKDHTLSISTITVAEIYQGARLEDKPDAEEHAESLLMQFHWHPIDGSVAQVTGEIQADLKQGGQRIRFQDAAIAATMKTRKQDYLITEDQQHFTSVIQDEHVLTFDQARSRL